MLMLVDMQFQVLKYEALSLGLQNHNLSPSFEPPSPELADPTPSIDGPNPFVKGSVTQSPEDPGQSFSDMFKSPGIPGNEQSLLQSAGPDEYRHLKLCFIEGSVTPKCSVLNLSFTFLFWLIYMFPQAVDTQVVKRQCQLRILVRQGLQSQTPFLHWPQAIDTR